MSNTPDKNTDYEVLMFGVLEGIRQAAAGENTVERVHKSLMKLIKDWHEQAQSDYLERVMPEDKEYADYLESPSWVEIKAQGYDEGWNACIDQIRQNARKEKGDE